MTQKQPFDAVKCLKMIKLNSSVNESAFFIAVNSYKV